MLFSVSASSAAISGPKNVLITSEDSNEYAQLSVNKKVFSLEKRKIPSKYKKYADYTFQVAKGTKIKYKPSVYTGGNGFITNMKGAKVKNAVINFGDGHKAKTVNGIYHGYKKSGWYKITVTFNATFTSCKFLTMNSEGQGRIVDASRTYLVKVVNAPQLSLSKITSGFKSYKNYKKRNIDFVTLRVKNIGSKISKATKVYMWYQKPGTKNVGKVYTKLKKYTASAKLKALKPGKSTTLRLYFKIPKKYAKLVKNVRLGTTKLTQISRNDAFYVVR